MYRSIQKLLLDLLGYQRALGNITEKEEQIQEAMHNVVKEIRQVPEEARSLLMKDAEVGPLLDQIYNTLHDMIQDSNRKKATYSTKLLLSVRDNIFRNELSYTVQANRYRIVSSIFDKFIRGITYFADEQEDAYPIYHRLVSCGKIRDVDYTDFHTCFEENANNEIAKQRIKTCYLERLIYDDIYRHQTLHFPVSGTEGNVQDESHQFWLQKTKNDFHTCFPNMDVQLTLKYENTYPVYMKAYVTQNGNFIEETEFQKRLNYIQGHLDYDLVVHCVRKTPTEKYREKFQTFLERRQWEKTKNHMVFFTSAEKEIVPYPAT